MIRRLYLANGTLQAALPKWSDDITVDTATAQYMLSVLNIGDWAYLELKWMDNTEIIKVYLNYSGLQVNRSQDGSSRFGFPVGSTVKYKLTQAEIQDATENANTNPLNVYASLTGFATVTGSAGTWTIGYPNINVQGVGGIKGHYSISDATLYLDQYYPAAGCCSIAGTGAPLIAGPDFYFTSQPYPAEGLDWMEPNPNRDKPGQNTNFGFGDLWLLTQPNVVEPGLGSTPDLISVLTFGSAGSFSVTDEYINPNSVFITSAETFGGAAAFTAVEATYMEGNCYILQALLYGSEVQYNNGLDEYMGSGIILQSATVQ